MSTTKDFTAQDGTVITIKRPSFRAFNRVASKVEALLDVDLGAAMGVPEFEEVLRACIQDVNGQTINAAPTGDKPDALDEWLEGADYQEAARLWDDIVKHGEFIPFYEARRKEHYARSKDRMDHEMDLLAAQIKKAKNSGMLREEFSAESLIMQQMGLTSLPSLSTGTQAGTAGQETKSKAKTTGSSSGTSRKQQNGGKRSKN